MPRRLLSGLALLTTACMSWTPGWQTRPAASRGPDPAAALLAEAHAELARADSRAALVRAIALFERAALAAPDDVAAATGACEAWCLLGAGYETGRAAKRRAYTAAIQHCEREMATNPGFSRRVAAGEPFDAVIAELGEAEMGAMHFWVTAVSYRFKETLSPLLYPFNLRWIERERAVIERMTSVDPDWGDGAAAFAQGIFFLALPERFGGDMARSRELLDTLVESHPGALLPRWGRAKYYHDKTGDRAAWRRDLEWVAARDPAAATGSFPWNAYFHADARRMLAKP